MPNVTKIITTLACTILIFAVGFQIGRWQGSQIPYFPTDRNNPANVDLSQVWTVWTLVQEKFVDQSKIDPQKMVWGMVKGAVASVEDPYTFFLTPEENKQAKDGLRGEFEGIGAQLGLKEGQTVVIAPIKGSPAEAAGIRAGDYILKVDGVDIRSKTLSEVVSKIRGKKGTQVKLTLYRTEEFEVTVTRQNIVVSPVELSYEGNVAIIAVNQFGDDTNAKWADATAEVAQKYQNGEVKSLVVDLRDNPGGYLESAVYLASEFLPVGKVIVKQESRQGTDRTYVVDRRGSLQDIPLVVLINGSSASASEIFSGAMRDHKRAVLVGQKSYGKGSVQEPIDLPGGAGVHITIAKFILPGGDWINSKGIEPGIVVENDKDTENTLTKENDLQLKRAIEEASK